VCIYKYIIYMHPWTVGLAQEQRKRGSRWLQAQTKAFELFPPTAQLVSVSWASVQKLRACCSSFQINGVPGLPLHGYIQMRMQGMHGNSLGFLIWLYHPIRLCLSALISQPFSSVFLSQQISINHKPSNKQTVYMIPFHAPGVQDLIALPA
jgi:hypothetical protein